MIFTNVANKSLPYFGKSTKPLIPATAVVKRPRKVKQNFIDEYSFGREEGFGRANDMLDPASRTRFLRWSNFGN